ncbi:MAG: hypothetical protein MRQ10_02710 [Candidatus Midichloria mitochondrii]|nr:hypothetical protein [Candidatus Midichloria mitochondrii]MDJ1298969.1 hypothetical protein [Candidatus Midichloria mitochondrii]
MKNSPYLSVGYSGAFTNNGSWHFFAELGVMYQGHNYLPNQLSLDV